MRTKKEKRLIDVTGFASSSTIKPELNAVYVKYMKPEGGIVYVATDAFRLVEIEDPLIEHVHVKEGFYSLKDWKKAVKEGGFENVDIIPGSDKWTFPGYKAIMPQELKEVDLLVTRVDPSYFKDMVDLGMKFSGKLNHEVMREIKQNKKVDMLYLEFYRNFGVTMKTVLMALNK